MENKGTGLAIHYLAASLSYWTAPAVPFSKSKVGGWVMMNTGSFAFIRSELIPFRENKIASEQYTSANILES